MQLIYGAFTEGATAPEHYDQIVSVIGAAVVIDSEVLHRGAQSKNRWSATCTVQLCSSTGALTASVCMQNHCECTVCTVTVLVGGILITDHRLFDRPQCAHPSVTD